MTSLTATGIERNRRWTEECRQIARAEVAELRRKALEKRGDAVESLNAARQLEDEADELERAIA
jgi:hypothetical protein